MTKPKIFYAFVPTAFGVLAACGGASPEMVTDTPRPIITPFSEETDPEVTLAGVFLDSGARTTGSLNGTLDRTSEELSIGTQSGRVNADATEVLLADGGRIAITPSQAGFAARFIATPQNSARTIGVIGVATPVADLPNGSASFSGNADVIIQDDVTLYTLTGDASLTANFSVRGGSVTTEVTDLKGTQRLGVTAPESVNDVATITFSDSEMLRATFSGGALTLNSDKLTAISDDAVVSLDGVFLGDGADEVGVTFVIDDDAAGSITAFGTILAD